MKAVHLFAAAVAFASAAFGGTGVTQRQLTNAVNEAKAEMRTYTDGKVENLTNLTAYVKHTEMTNYVTEATKDLTNLTHYVTHPQMTNYVEQVATNVSLAANGSLTNAIGHVMDFIEADLDEASPEVNPDGSITIVHIDYSLGYPRRVKIRLMPQTQLVYAERLGMRVVSSSYSPIPEGTLFACVGGGTNFYNSAKGTISFEVSQGGQSGDVPHEYYHFYGNLGGGMVLDSDAPYPQTQNRIVVYRNTATMDYLVGSFSVVPYRLTDEEFEQVAAGMTPAEENEWAELENPRLTGFRYGFTQLDNVRRLLKSGAKGLLGASNDLPLYMGIGSYPNAPKYNWDEIEPPDEDHYWEPQYWYKEEDWRNPLAWLSFPLDISIPYEYDGVTYHKQKRVNSFTELSKYFNVPVPPTPYKEPTLVEKKDYCKFGQHIYVKCVCSKCGHKRDHAFEPLGQFDTKCATCILENTKVETSAHGELVPTGTTGVKCGHKCDIASVEYHTGWHHESADSENLYTCACQCRTFSNSHVWLAHLYEDIDDNTVWHDAEDGAHHYADVKCQRERTNPHENRVIREHRVKVEYDEQGVPTNVHPHDGLYHAIYGDCEVCGAEDLQDHFEPHTFKTAEAGEEVEWYDGSKFTAQEPFCYCDTCWASTHMNPMAESLHEIVWVPCGAIVNVIIYCARCGKLIAHNEHDFFSENNYEDETYHRCACGLDFHKHKKNETSEKCEGGYHWHEEYDDMGRPTGGHWDECETDDGCDHDFKEDEPHGQGDIQCDTGKVTDPDNPPPSGEGMVHTAQGGELPQSRQGGRGKRRWRDVNDPCPVHTKSTGVSWTIEWENDISLEWFTDWRADMPTIWCVPVQWGTRRFSGNSRYKPKSFRVMRYATWLEWWNN